MKLEVDAAAVISNNFTLITACNVNMLAIRNVVVLLNNS